MKTAYLQTSILPNRRRAKAVDRGAEEERG
jgi:hypothetical protein